MAHRWDLTTAIITEAAIITGMARTIADTAQIAAVTEAATAAVEIAAAERAYAISTR
jgi:hypothetical protein